MTDEVAVGTKRIERMKTHARWMLRTLDDHEDDEETRDNLRTLFWDMHKHVKHLGHEMNGLKEIVEAKAGGFNGPTA